MRFVSQLEPDVAEAINHRITDRIGADSGGWALTKLLRVPGTLNFKYDPPESVNLLVCDDRSYGVDEVEAAFPVERPISAPVIPLRRRSASLSGSTPVKLPPWAVEIWEGTNYCTTEKGLVDRSRSLFQIAAVLLKHGASSEQTRSAIEERDSALGWNKYSVRADSVVSYDEVVAAALADIEADPMAIVGQTGRDALQKLRDAREPGTVVQEIYDKRDLLTAVAFVCKGEPALLDGTLNAVGKLLTTAEKSTFRKAIKTAQASNLTVVSSSASARLTKIQSVCPGAPVSPDIVVPAGWDVSMDGVRVTGNAFPVTHSPVVISARAKELAAGAEYLTLGWYRDGRWQKRTVERIVVSERGKLVSLSDYGLPVTSGNAADLVRYLAAFDSANEATLEPHPLTHRFGWHSFEESPVFVWGATTLGVGELSPSIEFNGSSAGDDQLAKGLAAAGTVDAWLEAVRSMSAAPRAMVALYASLASPLLHLLGAPNFAVNFSNPTSTGKTTVLRLAASAWGKATDEGGDRFMGSWDQTRVAMERRAGTLGHLPLILDDTKRAKRPSDIPQLLYDHADGTGKSRGSLDGLRVTAHWNSILISSGESPLTAFSQDGGTRARVLEVWGSPLEGVDEPGVVANVVRETFTHNYGHAGPLFIRYVLDHQSEWADWKSELKRLWLARVAVAGNHEVGSRLAANFAVIELAASIAHRALGFDWDFNASLDSTWDDVMREVSAADRPKAALESVLAVAVSQRRRFFDDEGNHEAPYAGWMGRWDEYGDCIGFVREELDQVLVNLGYDPVAIQKTWTDRGWVLKDKDGGNKRTRIQKSSLRLVTVTIATLESLFGPLHGEDD